MQKFRDMVPIHIMHLYITNTYPNPDPEIVKLIPNTTVMLKVGELRCCGTHETTGYPKYFNADG